jgi:phosphoribosylaminoimidazolecarboxamide formyltransferase/IMP cyclohydrolase
MKWLLPQKQVRTCLNGLLIQERNNITDTKDLKPLPLVPTEEIKDLILLLKFVKHEIKHNCICKKRYLILQVQDKPLELMF